MNVKTNIICCASQEMTKTYYMDTQHSDYQLVTTKHIQRLAHIIPREVG